MQRTRTGRRRNKRGLLASGLLAAVAVAAGATPAHAAVTATFSSGQLSVSGDNQANTITVSRDAAGKLLVNGGAVNVIGGTPTVANVSKIQVFGQGGHDTISLSEVNGALPAANLFGANGNDTLTGGSGGDQLFGQAGNDTMLGKGANDFLFGGSENDTLTGGDADDQVFGQSGNDRMVWSPGDDTDLNEGGENTDTVEVNGGGGAEQFTTTANGTRVRFDRLDPAPFAIDIGTSENLVLNANGGDDKSSATGNLAALIKSTVDGGTGVDTILGSNGADLLLGGDGNDFVDGQQGNDTAFLGAHDDTFQWDPGDGSDVVEGQAGSDKLLFNGSAANENITVSANGARSRLFRDIANITMDMDDVETADVNALGGADNVRSEDLSGTDMTQVDANLAAPGGVDDLAADNVIVTATNDEDVVSIVGSAGNAQALGLPARTTVSGASAATDRLTVNGLDGGDVLDASALVASAIALTLDGGLGDDVILGGAGDDTLLGGEGDDVILGGDGLDVIDGGLGDNVVIQAIAGESVSSATKVGDEWVASHAREVKGKVVLEVDGEKRKLPRAGLSQLQS